MSLRSCVMPWTVCLFASLTVAAEQDRVVYRGAEGPGQGKHIVLVSGDEEYRSEEALPQLARILAVHHGFTCTVLFAIDRETGEINPDERSHIPGLDTLQAADLLILFTRFRDPPPDQMKHIVDYVEAGRPIIGMRTATHAFNLGPKHPYLNWTWNSREWSGGFGRQVLGETWISHHGAHGKESTRGIIAPGAQDHPILKGIDDGDVWGPTDVYGVKLPLPGDSQPLLLGQVVAGMQPEDPPVEGPKNHPMMPVAWTKSYAGKSGEKGRVFTTTMGASQDLQSEGFRRLLVNAVYWCVGMEQQITGASPVDLVGEFEPTKFGFGGFRKGLKPSDWNWPQ